METQYLNIQELCKIVSVSKPTIYRMIRDGHFPPPTRIGLRKSRWHVLKIEQWIDKLESN